jgi:hypothetical protein
MPRAGLTVAELERWELFGGRWSLVESTPGGVVVDLCTCEGRLVERRESDSPELIDHVVRPARPGGQPHEARPKP